MNHHFSLRHIFSYVLVTLFTIPSTLFAFDVSLDTPFAASAGNVPYVISIINDSSTPANDIDVDSLIGDLPFDVDRATLFLSSDNTPEAEYYLYLGDANNSDQHLEMRSMKDMAQLKEINFPNIDALGSFNGYMGGAIDPINGDIYVILEASGCSRCLYKINLHTLVATQITNWSYYMIALEFDSSGQLWAMSGLSDDTGYIYKVDKVTGARTLINQSVASESYSMVFNPADQLMYVMDDDTYVYTFNPFGTDNAKLTEVDDNALIGTDSATFIGMGKILYARYSNAGLAEYDINTNSHKMIATSGSISGYPGSNLMFASGGSKSYLECSGNSCTIPHLIAGGQVDIKFWANVESWPDTPAADPAGTKTSSSTDSDGDGIPDAVESANGLDPFHADADEDADGDGVSNADEIAAGTDPNNNDNEAQTGTPVEPEPSELQSAIDAVVSGCSVGTGHAVGDDLLMLLLASGLMLGYRRRQR